MSKTFNEFLIEKEFTSRGISVILEKTVQPIKEFINFLPQLSLDIPEVEKKSSIEDVADLSNPITVRLADGSVLYFTNEEFRRLNSKPQKGKTMIVRFQRLPSDKSSSPSKITFCSVI